MSSALGDIVITGSGVIAPLGHDPATLLGALCAGRTAVAPVTAFDASPFPCRVAAAVSGFDPRQFVKSRRDLKLMTPAVQFGMAALSLACTDGGVPYESLDPERLGLFVGAGTAFGDTYDLVPAIEAGFGEDGFDLHRFAVDGTRQVSPLWLLKGLSNNVLGFGSAVLDARGTNQNYCNSAVGGLQAIGEAAWALAEGTADVIVAGGADSAVNPAHFTGFGRLDMLTAGTGADAVRPFSVDHDGFAPGEGAAFFVLETRAHAEARGARVHGRVCGYGNGCAAHVLPSCDPETIAAAGRRALETAGWAPSEVDVVFAHGNATPAFDDAEARALALLFGEAGPAVTSGKAQLGHTIAASGPLAVACALEAGRVGRIPPVTGITTVAPGASHLDLVRAPRQASVRRVLIHAAGLGGQTTFLALEIAP
ncbi:MAG: beta-ketoacyl-[acyl-carrier-protein] synthase family protein [bacterium]